MYICEAKFGPSEELYGMEVDVETTIKEVKHKLNETVIFGEFEPNQYLIYKGGEQEDKYKNTKREPHAYYYKYIEPVSSEDGNKTLQDHDLYDNDLLYLNVQLKLLLKVTCCRFSTIYVYTHNTLKHIQKKQ